VQTLAQLQERRAFDCRLTPDRALQTLDEAEDFARDRGLLTRTADSALPSLFEACHEEPYKPGAGGFGEWPRTKWQWFGLLAGRPGLTAVKVHRGKHLLVTGEVVALLDPIVRAELERVRALDREWTRLLDHLADAGPSTPEDLRVELELKPKELKDLRSPLERCGVLVGRHELEHGVVRWDQLFPEPAGGNAELDDLLVAGVRAAVVAPERELRRWFSWSWRFRRDLVERLVDAGRLYRPESGWVAVSPARPA
jgi:hypothetical protein